MAKLNETIYLIHKNDTPTIQIILKKAEHKIFYQTIENNVLTDIKILDYKFLDDFSLLTLKETTNLLYKNLDNNIILNRYKNKVWTSYILIENNLNTIDSNALTFTSIKFNEKIFLFLKNYNSANDLSYIFYQHLNDNLSLSPPILIDKINFNLPNSLLIEKSDENFYIFYSKFDVKHLLGFKTLNLSNKDLSEFNTIISSEYPISNYSATIHNETIKISYEEETENVALTDSYTVTPKITKEFHAQPESLITDSSIFKDIDESILNSKNSELSSEFETNTELNELNNSTNASPEKASNIQNKKLTLEDKLLNLKNENIKLKVENTRLQRELLNSKREFNSLKNKFIIFYKQISRFLNH
ncbi:MAG: hypothetical protein ACRC6T_03710 [Sarcina sp.]